MYTDGTVAKDQSRWGFTVKHGATSIHEDSAAYTVSASGLTTEVKAVTHVKRCDIQTTHAIILTDSRMMILLQKVLNFFLKTKKNGKPDW